MIQIIYSSIIIILILIIFTLMRKIRRIKKEHRLRLANLYKLLSKLTSDEKIYRDKIKLDNSLAKKISEAKAQLNTDIFDLQINIFKKIIEK